MSVVVAVIPSHYLLDDEASAASSVGLPVIRFSYLDDVEIVSCDVSTNPLTDPQPPRTGIFRGFMLSEERYQKLFDQLITKFNITLTTLPHEYARAHYFPNAYSFIQSFAPRAVWCPVDSPKTVTTDTFLATAQELVSSWLPAGITHVMLKDYVKSAKPHFLKVPLEDVKHVAQCALHLVHERGSAFNRGVVFKEYVETPPRINEWRMWYIRGKLHSCDYNVQVGVSAGQAKLPADVVEKVTAAVQCLQCTFITVDMAYSAKGEWFCLEVGDGGVSGPAVCQDVKALWRELKAQFG
eukprot:PhF_6_TR28353/c0_g1_i3/m.42047